MRYWASRLTASVGLTVASTSFAWTSWIGVLEDWPQKDQSKPDQPASYESRVRPLFVRVDQQAWQAAPHAGQEVTGAALPRTFAWDVCFSGRGEGSVTAMMSETSPGGATPPYVLRESDKAPWRTRRSLDYAGWVAEAVYKPIVLSSSMNSSCKDPEKWKNGTGEKAKAMLASLVSLTNAELAKTESKAMLKKGTAKLPKAWASAKVGRFVVLKGKTAEGKDVQATFFTADAEAKFVGFDTMLVDAGDFDSDGRSELVLKQRGEKRDVYMLYHGGEKVAESVWEY